MNSILLVEITKRYDNSDVFVPESDGIGPQQYLRCFHQLFCLQHDENSKHVSNLFNMNLESCFQPLINSSKLLKD